ncbi:SCP extracellular domain containing protein [Aphelenchoides fujianensis]|nr:SCP extracellular domain containing protein [Aphelenchoides fujianensis]
MNAGLFILLLVHLVVCQAALSPLTVASRKVALDEHNKYRSLVAQGGAKDRGVVPLPTAAKMRKLTYSLELEAIATQVAEKCDISVHTTGRDFVENFAVYQIKVANISQEKAVVEGVKKWFNELQVGVNGLQFTKSTSTGVRHFTQLAWETSEEIGCAVNFCSYIKGSMLNGLNFNNRAMIVCEYRPKGNKYGKPIYEAGQPCSQCASLGMKCDSLTQLCYDPAQKDFH